MSNSTNRELHDWFHAIDTTWDLNNRFFFRFIQSNCCNNEALGVDALVAKHHKLESERYAVLFDIFVKNLYEKYGILYLGPDGSLPVGTSIVGVPASAAHFEQTINENIESVKEDIEDLKMKLLMLDPTTVHRIMKARYQTRFPQDKKRQFLALSQMVLNGDFCALEFITRNLTVFMGAKLPNEILQMDYNPAVYRYFSYVGLTNEELVLL